MEEKNPYEGLEQNLKDLFEIIDVIIDINDEKKKFTDIFVDYLFELYEGRIPDPVNLKIVERDNDTIFFDKPFRCCITLGTHPVNIAPILGFVLFGYHWTSFIPNYRKKLKERAKKWKEENASLETHEIYNFRKNQKTIDDFTDKTEVMK